MRAARASVPARVAPAGNPSDAYGGRTLSLAIANFCARAEVDLARSLDAPANFAGSGGAVVVILTDERHLERLGGAYRSEGCELERCVPAEATAPLPASGRDDRSTCDPGEAPVPSAPREVELG
jgi:hypothetical protein